MSELEEEECYDLGEIIDLIHRVNNSVLRKRKGIPSLRYKFIDNDVILDWTLDLVSFLPSARKLRGMARIIDGYYHIHFCR